jgi:hypothetical protein
MKGSSDIDLSILAVKENAKWVNTVLAVGVPLFGAIVLLKFLGATKFTWEHITIGTSQAWIAAVIFTVAHLYSTILLVRSLRVVWSDATAEQRRRLAKEIVATGGLFVRGLVSRTKVLTASGGPFIRYRMEIDDPTAWVSQLALPVLVLAVVPFSWSLSLLLMIPVAVVIAEANWTIGSHWAIALSDLASHKSGSTYFAGRARGSLQLVTLASQGGDYAFNAIPWPYAAAWLALQGIGLSLRTPMQVGYMVYANIRRLVMHRSPAGRSESAALPPVDPPEPG